MLQFGNMSDELTRYNTQLFGEKVAPDLRTCFADYPTRAGRPTPADRISGDTSESDDHLPPRDRR